VARRSNKVNILKAVKNKYAGLKSIARFDNRWELVTKRVFFANNGLTVYNINGLKILVDHSSGDENGVRDCFTTDMYSHPLLSAKH
jgi:hypothetical protein